jgi:outer membrane protein assembly factor BamB
LVFSDKAIAYQTYPWPSQLHIIDLETGESRWKTPLSIRGFSSDNKSRLFIIMDNRYQAFESESGKLIWTSEVRPIERGSSALLYDPSTDELYVWEDSRILVVLDAETGKLRRRLDHRLSDGNPLMVHNSTLYVRQLHPEYLLAFDGDNNKALWKAHGLSPSDMFSPIISENIFYVRSAQESLFAIDINTGVSKWQYPRDSDSSTSTELLSNPTILQGVVYGIFSDARLRGFDATTGQEVGHIQFADVSQVPLQQTVPGLATSREMLYTHCAS